jgi:hypothetical protein
MTISHLSSNQFTISHKGRRWWWYVCSGGNRNIPFIWGKLFYQLALLKIMGTVIVKRI